VTTRKIVGRHSEAFADMDIPIVGKQAAPYADLQLSGLF